MTFSHPHLEHLDISHLVSISQVVTQAKEWKPALDKIVRLVRSIFIFDNLALYLYDEDNDSMDIMYARAIGRGQKAEADVSWGESIASRIQKIQKTIVDEPLPDPKKNRLEQPYILAVPLMLQQQFLGALVYIRFGGPPFTPENIQLGEYITWHISLLVQRQKIQDAYKVLENHTKLMQFQEDFISTISHELRTPLGFIKGYSTTLLRSDTEWDPATQHEFLQIIESEANHLQHLIDNMLDSARLQSGQLPLYFEQVYIDHLLEDISERTRLHYPDLRVNLHLETPIFTIKGDPNRLTQVFENILANAAKYAPGKDVDIIVHQDEDELAVMIRDQGPGISSDDLPHIFERFYRSPKLESTVRGTGLGLYICNQIVQAHHGKISVTSQPGSGTTFTIILPCLSSQE
ncbi:MAG: HAMP domain-containing sensor histidine kinase [Anaerolineaceae bacterium]